MYTYNAKIYNIVDGDTVDAEIDLGFKVRTKQRLRLRGIDTPERGQPGYDAAKAFVADKVYGKDVLITTFKASKFGYYLAEVVLPDNKILNDILVNEGLAEPYNGGKKE